MRESLAWPRGRHLQKPEHTSLHVSHPAHHGAGIQPKDDGGRELSELSCEAQKTVPSMHNRVITLDGHTALRKLISHSLRCKPCHAAETLPPR